MGENKAIKGGEFVIRETPYTAVFIPEEFDEEAKMIRQTCLDFLDTEVLNKLDRIDAQEEGLMPSLMDKAGELGMLGVSIPEEYGGFGKNFNTSMLVADAVGGGFSFAVALSAHTGIGTLPILYYGNDAQKAKYVPKLATGEWKASYCLTEPNAGSDANSGRTSAKLNAEGTHYLINGQKMWITNGGFADIFIVFAKIDDDKNLTAFIVEKDFGGITMNPEEHKLGIKGSSTRQIFFNDCAVPVENMLSDRENGFKIAVNILNIGRIKLGAATIGSARMVINHAVQYANERVQFNLPISKFGAIRYKLAEMATRLFAVESASYRAGQNIDDAYDALIAGGMDEAKAKLKSVEQFAIECAIIKVWCSEMLDYVVDEGVQIYGGMGYSADAPMERAYRDSRINRIFEGTNEVNRLLVVDMLLKRAMKGELDLMGPAQAVAGELLAIPDFGEEDDAPFAVEKKIVANLKKAGLLIAGAAVQKLMMSLSKEEEILMNIADIIGYVYITESVLLRAEKLLHTGSDKADYAKDMAKIYLYGAIDKISAAGKEALYSFGEGDELNMMLVGLRRFTKAQPFNVKDARQRIAKKLIDENKYCF
ncbi:MULTISPECIES: acyl-CoA dehydrogenase family protein [Sphingobacterium]|uniref:Acyl-CoA dehydrogenase family protein n=1 Tax=Sphingobacterium paramultivorum TaxID=2886510 RepID=A0A7G5E8D5_9SPHI|nr:MULTISPECIES: acyl-CoA dehydrogenase family protein [Sphingobacterium]MBB1644357.1 acyl-CoA dehydrogenase [Sphingobacterium sp. UME9]MCS4166521.1 alkylation response protein AidB-like acyl-CoA dehydrogenase [Sphingobacterium sp. BIGb0116]QMV70260.1 acyl-CoA dehydrogenase family protein [Sphingobacterium paramultivorum]WET71310.1 MAG: acyl-CoA dehydrogenase family protein [Sphingobacterium sp.]WSO14106.1 acyl-CoA dehydrogenase family protein [Sphingobacterium paramultivorum]